MRAPDPVLRVQRRREPARGGRGGGRLERTRSRELASARARAGCASRDPLELSNSPGGSPAPRCWRSSRRRAAWTLEDAAPPRGEENAEAGATDAVDACRAASREMNADRARRDANGGGGVSSRSGGDGICKSSASPLARLCPRPTAPPRVCPTSSRRGLDVAGEDGRVRKSTRGLVFRLTLTHSVVAAAAWQAPGAMTTPFGLSLPLVAAVMRARRSPPYTPSRSPRASRASRGRLLSPAQALRARSRSRFGRRRRRRRRLGALETPPRLRRQVGRRRALRGPRKPSRGALAPAPPSDQRVCELVGALRASRSRRGPAPGHSARVLLERRRRSFSTRRRAPRPSRRAPSVTPRRCRISLRRRSPASHPRACDAHAPSAATGARLCRASRSARAAPRGRSFSVAAGWRTRTDRAAGSAHRRASDSARLLLQRARAAPLGRTCAPAAQLLLEFAAGRAPRVGAAADASAAALFCRARDDGSATRRRRPAARSRAASAVRRRGASSRRCSSAARRFGGARVFRRSSARPRGGCVESPPAPSRADRRAREARSSSSEDAARARVSDVASSFGRSRACARRVGGARRAVRRPPSTPGGPASSVPLQLRAARARGNCPRGVTRADAARCRRRAARRRARGAVERTCSRAGREARAELVAARTAPRDGPKPLRRSLDPRALRSPRARADLRAGVVAERRRRVAVLASRPRPLRRRRPSPALRRVLPRLAAAAWRRASLVAPAPCRATPSAAAARLPAVRTRHAELAPQHAPRPPRVFQLRDERPRCASARTSPSRLARSSASAASSQRARPARRRARARAFEVLQRRLELRVAA